MTHVVGIGLRKKKTNLRQLRQSANFCLNHKNLTICQNLSKKCCLSQTPIGSQINEWVKWEKQRGGGGGGGGGGDAGMYAEYITSYRIIFPYIVFQCLYLHHLIKLVTFGIWFLKLISCYTIVSSVKLAALVYVCLLIHLIAMLINHSFFFFYYFMSVSSHAQLHT